MDRAVGSRYLAHGQALGSGATGTVYRGLVRDTGRTVAVKLLHPELAGHPEVVMRFLRERELLMHLHHPNVVQVHDLVVEGETLALIMDLIDGPDLRTYLRAHGPVPPVRAALLVADVADALAAAHDQGIVHRDLKPANVLLDLSKGGLHPLLTDFGVARLAGGDSPTQTAGLLGTPLYMAPEMAQGKPAGTAADVYAAGILLYELLSGQVPFQHESAYELLRRHVEQAPPRPVGIPDPLWTVITACLAKQPDPRPEARGLAAHLRWTVAAPGSVATIAATTAIGHPPEPDAARYAPTVVGPLPGMTQDEGLRPAAQPSPAPTLFAPPPAPYGVPVTGLDPPSLVHDRTRYVRVGHKGMGIWSTREVRPRRRGGCMLWLPRLLLMMVLLLSLFWCGYDDGRSRPADRDGRPGSTQSAGDPR